MRCPVATSASLFAPRLRRPRRYIARPGAPRARVAAAAAALAVLALLLPPRGAAQGPEADWRTVEVPGYRVHFPAPAEAWARHLAARLPALRERVEGAVGRADEGTVEVVLLDPLAQANGAALPLLGSPRMILLLTPPEASSSLADHAGWIELLAVHEQAHLTHLLRPTRRPLDRLLGLPVGPLALRAPRWAVEGYATLLEGRLTGRGRPYGALRAAVLRRWAQLGRLPSYGALSGGADRYLGGSMAYLAGSAFLEWLEGRAGADSFDRLWRRLSARRARDFEDAFRGVYGESPAALWGVFTAELTWKAMEAQRRLAPALREGEPWLERSWGTGGPALSRDGSRLALVLRDRDRPPRLAVFATAEDAEAARRRAAERDRLLRRDPLDVPAVDPPAPPREPLATLELPFTTVAPAPRFLPDGSLLFARTRAAADGTLHPDLFRWWPDEGRVARVTRGADLKAADPAPDGTWAVAVRSRWGRTSLVRVQLASGAVEELVTGNVTTILDAPRLSPDGARLAYLRHDEGAGGAVWRLLVRELASGAERVVETPAGAAVADPAWAPDGATLYAVVGEGGLLDVQALPVFAGSVASESARRAITRSPGAALAPEPSPDGARLFFLSLDADGLDVRTLALDPAAAPPPPPALGAALAPAVPPALPEPPPPLTLAGALAEVPPSRPYGFGPAEWASISGGAWAASGSTVELGVRGGDPLGRWQVLALGGPGWDGGAGGAALGASWRGWPAGVTGHLYSVEELPSEQADAAPEVGSALDRRERGFELAFDWDRAFDGGGLALRAALGEGRRERRDGPERGRTVERRSLLVEAGLARALRRGPWEAAAGVAASWQPGETDGERWTRRRGRVELSLGRSRGPAARVEWERGALAGAAFLGEQLRVGGLGGSLLPPTASGERVDEPGLPAAVLVGVEHEGQRLALERGSGTLPVRLFYARHRVQGVEGSWGEWLALAGVEAELELPPLPLARLPATRLRGGLAYLLDEPQRGDVNAWLGIAWRP